MNIRPLALTRERFSPFGDVIEFDGAHHYAINGGTTERFHDLAKIEAAGPHARVLVSLFRGRPFSLPLQLTMMERHPLGSQAFFPLQPRPWLVAVAPDQGGKPGVPLVFRVDAGANGLRGVNYRRNVWHHPLVALEAESDFLVVDRGGEGNNLEEYVYSTPFLVAE
jgi:ureidoglycolate lyase